MTRDFIDCLAFCIPINVASVSGLAGGMEEKGQRNEEGGREEEGAKKNEAKKIERKGEGDLEADRTHYLYADQ